jgi:hypothetical protein
MSDKAAFFWAIVGDSEPEPVAVTGEPGNRMAYTIGCADPFPLDIPSPNIEIVCESGMFGGGNWRQEPVRLRVPEKLRSADHDKARNEAERRLERDRKRGVVHGYAGFGGRAA